MTLKEKVAELQPEDVDAVYIGGVLRCPWEYDFLGVKKECPYPELKVCEEHCGKKFTKSNAIYKWAYVDDLV